MIATVKEIQTAIEMLSPKELEQLKIWFAEQEWAQWDEQLETDIALGKLDFLLEEAMAEKKHNLLQEF